MAVRNATIAEAWRTSRSTIAADPAGGGFVPLSA
jgi:hypothetical protein